jgi:hypothetical protein
VFPVIRDLEVIMYPTYPTPEALPLLGLCPVCLDSPVGLNGGESPLNADETQPVNALHLITEEEIETALSTLKG